jgi:hypothetical protein
MKASRNADGDAIALTKADAGKIKNAAWDAVAAVRVIYRLHPGSHSMAAWQAVLALRRLLEPYVGKDKLK